MQRRRVLWGGVGALALGGCAAVSEVDSRKTSSFEGSPIDRFSLLYEGAAAGSLQLVKSSPVKDGRVPFTDAETRELSQEGARLLVMLGRGFNSQFAAMCKQQGLSVVPAGAGVPQLKVFASAARIDSRKTMDDMKFTVGSNLTDRQGKSIWYFFGSLGRVSESEGSADRQFQAFAAEMLGRMRRDGVIR